jgi:hypothetical protein
MTASPLVTITGDGTFLPPRPGLAGPGNGPGTPPGTGGRAGTESVPLSEAPALSALTRLRSLLGDDLEDQISTRMYLPVAGGSEPADHALPASLSLLAETSGDLTSYGWRVGTGAGRAWLRARELRDRMADAARIALFGYEGPLVVTALGPVSLAASTFVASGERTLADRGAVRDLPVLLAEGVAAQIRALRDRVPGAEFRVLLREDHVTAVNEGKVPTPSGYRRYPAVAAPELGPLWTSFVNVLREETADGARTAGETSAVPVTVQLPAAPGLLSAVRTARVDAVAIGPRTLGALSDARGRRRWENLADARERGTGLELVLDPARVEQDLGSFAAGWRELGYGPRDLAGLTLLAHRSNAGRGSDAHRGPDRRRGSEQRRGSDQLREVAGDPAAEPSVSSLLTEADLVRVLRAAPAWAERTQD